MVLFPTFLQLVWEPAVYKLAGLYIPAVMRWLPCCLHFALVLAIVVVPTTIAKLACKPPAEVGDLSECSRPTDVGAVLDLGPPNL